MESTHQGLVSRLLSHETTLGLTAPDPNSGTRLKKNDQETQPILAIGCFMYLLQASLITIKPALLHYQASTGELA